ncbi:MAG: DUF4838 domain-containing protein [Phycisphaeraceae bacterium]
MTGRMFIFVLGVSALLACGLPRPAAALEIATAGEVRVVIHHQADAPELTIQAANEMARVFGVMTGDEVSVRAVEASAQVEDGPAVLIGALAERAGLAMNATSISRDGFRYKVDGERVLLIGESPRGVYLGAHDLLERFGAGWYTPGEIGEVIPRKSDLALPDDLDHTETSTAMHRRFWYGGGGTKDYDRQWLLRLNGDLTAGGWSHAYARLIDHDQFENHPEWFGMVDGKRRPRQLCTTNEQVIQRAARTLIERMNDADDRGIVPAGPNDGGGLCECDNCMKLRTPDYREPSSNNLNASTQVFQFAVDLAERTVEHHPDKDLGILVYSDYSRAPRQLDTLGDHVFPMIAPIRRCRLHGPGHPGCPWNELLAEEIEAWAKLADGKLGFYIYNYNLADAMVPFSRITAFKHYQQHVQQADIEQLAWTMETMDSWATHAPHLWLSVRLSWDVNIDIDAEMDRFFTGFYGSAAKPMRRYWLRIDEAYATTDAHTGSQYALHHIWTSELLTESRRDIERAKALAANDREREAVAMAEAGLRCAELFMASWQALGACDFEKAARIEDELAQHIHDHRDEQHRPSWFRQRYAYGYHSRFVADTIRAGAEILRDGGRIVVKLPERWRFATDEQGVGKDNGFHLPDHHDSDWRTVGTFTESWADLEIGLGGFYHGDAWYRTTFDLPANVEDADLRLWFGGFDHNVEVYINGKHIGELTGFMRPQALDDIEFALKFGQSNVIAVRCDPAASPNSAPAAS